MVRRGLAEAMLRHRHHSARVQSALATYPQTASAGSEAIPVPLCGLNRA
jgi:hypothetical protein